MVEARQRTEVESLAQGGASMEASGTFEGDAEVIEDPTEHEILEAARKKFLLASDLTRKADSLKEEAKATQKQADAARAEAGQLIMRRNDPQLSIPTAPGESEPPCTDANSHTWERIREGASLLEDCSACGLERTAKVIIGQDGPDEPSFEAAHEPWVYTTPEKPAETEPVAT